jgi:hypothetical protein
VRPDRRRVTQSDISDRGVQVATEARTALAERDAAQAEAADARGARQAAEDRATVAEAAALPFLWAPGLDRHHTHPQGGGR